MRTLERVLAVGLLVSSIALAIILNTPGVNICVGSICAQPQPSFTVQPQH